MDVSVGRRITKRQIKTKVAEMKMVRSRGTCGVSKSSRTSNRLYKRKFKSNGYRREMGKKIDQDLYVCRQKSIMTS